MNDDMTDFMLRLLKVLKSLEVFSMAQSILLKYDQAWETRIGVSKFGLTKSYFAILDYT